MRARASRRGVAHLLVSWALLFASAACDSSSARSRVVPQADGACPGRPVRMAVAASLRDIAESLVERLEGGDSGGFPIEASFGASNALARQAEHGAPIDLLFSADAEIVEALAEAGIVDPTSLVDVAFGRIVVATAAGSPLEADGREAFHALHFERFGLPGEAVPLGRYGSAWLAHTGLLSRLDGKRVLTEDARATVAALTQGHVDAAILYESDLHPGLRVLLRPEVGTHPEIRYVGARIASAPACNEIDRVLAAWQSETTRKRLVAAGFRVEREPTRAQPSIFGDRE